MISIERLIEVLAGVMLVGGIAIATYAIFLPPQQNVSYHLTVEKVTDSRTGTQSESIEYTVLSKDARYAFGSALINEEYVSHEEYPSELRSHNYVIKGGTVYAIDIREEERVTTRLAGLLGGSTTAVIGAFVLISWYDIA